MKIRYLGHSCFELTSKSGVTIITDPYEKVGYELPKGLQADIVTVSHGHFDHAYIKGVHAGAIVSSLGKESLFGIDIEGIASYHDEKHGQLRGQNTIYKLCIDGLTICHMGDIGENCSTELLSKIGQVDILLLPVGGTYTIDAKGAWEYIAGIQPKAVIPMHYKPLDGSLDIAEIQPFLSICDEEILPIQGEIEVDERTQGVLYMERVK